MKKALLSVFVVLAALISPPVGAAQDTVSCADYSGRDKSACNNGKNLSNAFNTQYCQRYSAITQVEACEAGQYIGQYNYEAYCSQFGTNYHLCVMPTASSAPRQSDDADVLGATAPKGASSFMECSTIDFDFGENCSQSQKILKALNLALPLVYILGISGVVFGILMRIRATDYKQQKQGALLAGILVAILVAYSAVAVVLNIITPGGVLFEL